MRAAFLSVALLSVAAGCASQPCAGSATEAPTEHLTLRSPGGFDQLALQGGRIFGPNTDVTRYDDGYRGRAFNRSVDLRITDDVIEGSVGSGRTELHLQRLSDGFSLKGLYGGRLGELILQRDRLECHLGGRVYRLRASATQDGVYESRMGPADAPGVMITSGSVAGISPGPVEIALPAGFATLPAEHQATILALFLGR